MTPVTGMNVAMCRNGQPRGSRICGSQWRNALGLDKDQHGGQRASKLLATHDMHDFDPHETSAFAAERPRSAFWNC